MTPFTACGTVADYAIFDEELVALKPKNLTFDQAASIPLIGLTSYQALVEHTKLQKGEKVLILGGSSAVGMFAIQLAHAIGARVVTTASAKNANFVKGLGAERVINYHTQVGGRAGDPLGGRDLRLRHGGGRLEHGRSVDSQTERVVCCRSRSRFSRRNSEPRTAATCWCTRRPRGWMRSRSTWRRAPLSP